MIVSTSAAQSSAMRCSNAMRRSRWVKSEALAAMGSMGDHGTKFAEYRRF
ncbi:MAG: hypothetical protein IPH26_16535 [Sterolibacteriaceae bacterium]|uniref:Uncharacterized protein n=1 Tax=Candidatus Methylophosphatis roskildensis TaxID=2899263 RepID=A0A9D7E5D8_9PROT|nr:hypothetical protein [Candidatus Methylophosphatis roskildensis]